MSMTTELDLAQRMKAAALKATPGEWVYLPSNTSIEYDYGSDDSQGSITYMDSGDFTQKQTELNGIFIALANPANVLALVEALEAKEKQRSAANKVVIQQDIELQELRQRIAELEARDIQPLGVQLITEAIGAHGYIVGCLQQNRPDLALEESLKWVQGFSQAAVMSTEGE